MTDIFISYSRRDKAFVRTLHDALKADNRECWVDWEDIPPTADWRAEIQAGIEAADAFAFVISPDSVNSKVCSEEIDHALKLNKKLIPLLYREVLAETTHPSVSSHNWINFRESDDFPASVKTLITALDTDLAATKLHTRLLIRAREWLNRGRNPSFTLRGADLDEAEHWVARSAQLNPKPTPEQIEFIQASRKATNARQRVTMVSLGFGFIITIVLALLAFSQYTVAQDSLVQVQHKEATATNALGQAKINLHEAWDTQSLFLAAQAHQQLSGGNIRQALLLGLESLAHREQGIVHPVSYHALFGALSAPALDIIEMSHDASVISATWNRDESKILSVGGDKTARIWDAATGKELVRMVHLGPIEGAAWSPDETRVTTWSLNIEDVATRVWDAATGKLLFTIASSDGVTGYTEVMWSHDSKRILASDDSRSYIWDAATGKQIVALPLGARAIQWSADDAHLVGILPDYADLYTWDLTGNVVSKVPFSGKTSDLFWTRDQKRVAWWNNKTISIGDAATGNALVKMDHDDLVSGLRWSNDNTKLASWSADKSVRIWDVATGQILGRLSAETIVSAVQFSPDDAQIMTFNDDKIVRVWDIATGKLYFSFSEETLLGLVWNHDRSRLLSWGGDGSIRIWDIATHRAQIQLLHDGMYSAEWYNKDSQILTGGGDSLRLWDAATGKEVQRMTQPNSGVPFVSPDGKRVLNASDKTIHVWDIATSKEIATFQHDDTVTNTLWNKTGSQIVSWASDKTLRVWDVATGKEVFNIATPDNVWYAALNPDSSRLLWGVSAIGDVHLLDMTTGKEIAKFATAGDNAFAQWNHDGTRIMIASVDGMVRIMDAELGKEIQHFKLSEGGVGAWLSHDETRVATVSIDRILRIWDVNSGTELAKYPHNNDISQIEWSHDDSQLLFWSGSESSDGIVYILDGKTGRELMRLPNTNFLQGAHWSFDDSRIVSWTFGKDVIVWDRKTNFALAEITHNDLVSNAMWSADNTRILSVDLSGQALISLVDSDKLLQLAQSQKVQLLSDTDRKLFFLPPLSPAAGTTATPTPLRSLIGKGAQATQAAMGQATSSK